MLILGIDPGRDSPGYGLWSTLSDSIVYAGAFAPACPFCVATVETGGWSGGRMGVASVWSLGFGAATQLAAVKADRKFRITPRAWRAALGLRLGLPKRAIVGRLRRRYAAPPTWTDDMVEACGIAEATAIILARPKAKDRTSLKEIK